MKFRFAFHISVYVWTDCDVSYPPKSLILTLGCDFFPGLEHRYTGEGENGKSTRSCGLYIGGSRQQIIHRFTQVNKGLYL